LLGIKVIKLNKIKGTQTVGSNLLAAQNLARAISSKLETSIYRLKPKTKQTCRDIAASFRTTKISAQNQIQKIGCALMPNEKS
jgi:hypothetical protein